MVKSDLIHLFCGECLGSGIGRDTFVFGIDDTKVIKIEERAGSFQNVIEWETWESVQGTPGAKWLAPCRFISDSGSVLIMERTTPLGVLTAAKLPKRLPDWLTDHKFANYGLLKDRFVCHDYGTNLLLNHGAFDRKMREKIDWSEWS